MIKILQKAIVNTLETNKQLKEALKNRNFKEDENFKNEKKNTVTE